MSDTTVLNLYAGIGGNRKEWSDVDVTAVEINPKIARYYQEQFPNDEVIVADAHEFLQDHYNDGWDFIWSSVPCQTHSKMKPMMWASDSPQNKDRTPEYPDMRLYQEIILLRRFAECDWVVENVESYYEPLIEPQSVGSHYFWSNFRIPAFESSKNVKWGESNQSDSVYGFDVSDTDLGHRKDQVLNNCVDPELGKHVIDAATKDRQGTLPGV